MTRPAAVAAGATLASGLLLTGCLGFGREAAEVSGHRLGCSHSAGLADHTPAAARAQGWAADLDDPAPLDLRVMLPLRQADALEGHLAAMAEPTSPQYRRPLDPLQLRGHLPLPHDLEAARAALAAQGLATQVAPDGISLQGAATAGQAQAALGVRPRALAGGGHAPPARPRLPGDQALLAVRGLASPSRWQSHAAVPPAATTPLTPATLRSAYRVPGHAQGQGQAVALIALDGYDPADLAAYCRQHGLREVPRRHVHLGGYDGRVLSEAGQAETTMDLQLLNAMAPGLREIVVVLARPDAPHGLQDVLGWLLANYHAPGAGFSHISCSWGSPESGMSEAAVRSENALYQLLAAAGVTTWVASGDLGALANGMKLGVDWPASSPWVMGMGGTSLQVDAAGAWVAEGTWPGTGGGLSCFWPAPAWQAALPVAPEVDARWRRVPDAALAADPARGHAVVVRGRPQVMGGTSAAAPVAAAFAAAVDGVRAASGRGPVGFWPPVLYHLATRPGAPPILTDIADQGSNGFYFSGPSFDECTGFGSFRGDALLGELVALP